MGRPLTRLIFSLCSWNYHSPSPICHASAGAQPSSPTLSSPYTPLLLRLSQSGFNGGGALIQPRLSLNKSVKLLTIWAHCQLWTALVYITSGWSLPNNSISPTLPSRHRRAPLRLLPQLVPKWNQQHITVNRSNSAWKIFWTQINSRGSHPWSAFRHETITSSNIIISSVILIILGCFLFIQTDFFIITTLTCTALRSSPSMKRTAFTIAAISNQVSFFLIHS